jgi:hypothetical protein
MPEQEIEEDDGRGRPIERDDARDPAQEEGARRAGASEQAFGRIHHDEPGDHEEQVDARRPDIEIRDEIRHGQLGGEVQLDVNENDRQHGEAAHRLN